MWFLGSALHPWLPNLLHCQLLFASVYWVIAVLTDLCVGTLNKACASSKYIPGMIILQKLKFHLPNLILYMKGVSLKS